MWFRPASVKGIAARSTTWLAESSVPWKRAVYQSLSWKDISDAVGSVALAASSLFASCAWASDVSPSHSIAQPARFEVVVAAGMVFNAAD